MQFKDFEIRPCKDMSSVVVPYKYELVKWYNSDSCYTVAWMEYNNKDGFWDLRSVGLRLMEDWTDRLDQFIIKWCEMAAVCMEEGETNERRVP